MFKIFRKNCCGLDVHKTWIYACIGITDDNQRTVYHEARFSSFTKDLQRLSLWLQSHQCSDVCMESSGKYWIPVYNVLEQSFHVVLAHPKYTKPQKGNKTDRKDARWICDLFMCNMIKPSFIPPPDIRQLRDLVRYRRKLTNMITGEKNRAQNCLTVSNLKLDDVFADVFGKSSRSITEYILAHPGEKFDVAPFMDLRCKTSVEVVQDAVDGAVSHEQAVKLRECLNHIDQLQEHKSRIEQEIQRLAEPYAVHLNLIRSVPGLGSDPMTPIAILSEIGADMSVFPSSKHLVSWAGCCPRNDRSANHVKSTRISQAGSCLKPLLVQVANALIRSKDHPEFGARYRRIKAHRGHMKAIIAVCKMLLTAIWHILSNGEVYNPDGYLSAEPYPAQKDRVLSTKQALDLLRSRGFIIKDLSENPATA